MTDTITIHEQQGFSTSRILPTSILASTFEINKKVDKTIIRLSQHLDGSFVLTLDGSRAELTAEELDRIGELFRTQARSIISNRKD
ncbi:hypothetical protein [Bifidobacterium adolescentis]|jgi:hypothetical protein|uniref:hypothetical protein n=1 Tax=Bifidobacterium adolescentis TaxID=1680 RepID=UPI002A6749A7|nr:hypothetical protein [Bifidobacterium adolescentis]